MYVERNLYGVYGANQFDETDDDDDEKAPEGNYTVWVISKEVNVVTPYTYDEAIGLAGHGRYNIGLLVVCGLSLLALCIDFFSFSTVLAHASCDLLIGEHHHSFLVMIPFLGGISTAYLWGYLSDTRGRRRCLLVCLWGGFVVDILSAFAPDWRTLAVLKFIAVSFTSGIQSIAYTLVGECCPLPVKRAYMYLLGSAQHLALPIYTALGYAFLQVNFSFNLVYLTFTPWRLLVICQALPLVACALSLHMFYESPKFLANMDEKVRALEILKKIWKRNQCLGRKYSVEKLTLDEEGNAKTRSTALLKSLWEQTVPLFKPPFVFNTLKLYFLVMVGYSTTNSLLSWFPFLTNAFMSGLSSDDVPEGMCKIIEHSRNMTNADITSCTPKSSIVAVWASFVQALFTIIINIVILWTPNRKALVICMLVTMLVSAVGCAAVPNNVISLAFFFAILTGVVYNGVICSYFVDLFPTSYRGMASCLGMMVSRGSGLLGSTVTGLFIMSNCTYTFYSIATNILCGVIVACFLPSEKVKKVS